MGPQGLRRGRGARERILAAAQRLFAEQGINGTGMDQLCAEAQVSKRTAYQHFGSKDDLVAEYLRGLSAAPLAAGDPPATTPRERVLAVFEQLLTPPAAPLCPFIGAAVEIADPQHPARVEARHYKAGVVARLRQAASEAGAPDPGTLAEQLALLLDGASVRTRTLGVDAAPAARAIAAALIDAAVAG